MTILFNYPEIKSEYEMIKKIDEKLSLDDIYDSDVEDSYNFIFENVKFFIQYDINSEKNSKIYQYYIESHSYNDGLEVKSDEIATKNLYKKLKDIGFDATMCLY